MRQFPVILIPPEVQRIAQSKPVAPSFNVSLPSVPSYRHPKPIHVQEALALTLGLIVVVSIITVFTKELGIILLIVGTVAIIVRIKYQFETYKKRYQKHQESFQRYLTKLETYSREEIKYQQELAIAHVPERILEFRHQQFRKFFKKLPTHDQAIALNEIVNPFIDQNDQKLDQRQTDEQAIEGVIYYFGITLQQYLAGTIYQGVNLHIPSINYNWSPALTYIDPELNAHIAIEINLSSENAAVMMRNDLAERFLVDSGWIIIKFAQEQILQTSTECCREFAKLLDRLSLDPTVLPKFVDVADLTPIKQ